MLNAKPEDVRVQSPLSKLRSSEHWDLPLQGWKRSLRNKVLSLDHKSRKIVRGRPVTSKTSPERVSQPRKTVDNNYAKQASHTKEKQRDDDGISLVVSDAQPKDLSSGSRGCDHLEEGSRNKDDIFSDSKMEPALTPRKRKKRLRSNLPDSHNSSSALYESAGQIKRQENDSTASAEFKKSSENYHQDSKVLEEITPEPIESDIAKLSSLNSQELALSAAPKSTSDCSTTETFESSISTDTVGNSTLLEKDENELNVIEKPALSEHSEGNQSLISVEPIVVSSDEEGPVEHKSSEILKLQPKQDHVITNENESTSESALSELPLITCESVQASSELCPYNPVMENISCIIVKPQCF